MTTNPDLAAESTTPAREPWDLAEAAQKLIQALVIRAATGDLDALIELRQLDGYLAQSIREAGAGANASGHSYGRIAKETGGSAVAAFKRYSGTPWTGAPSRIPGSATQPWCWCEGGSGHRRRPTCPPLG